MKNKIIIIYIIMMFTLISIIHTDNNVKAAEAKYTYGFEGTVLTGQVACGDYYAGDGLTSSFETVPITSTCEVRDSNVHNGTKSFYFDADAAVNISYASCLGRMDDIMTEFEIYDNQTSVASTMNIKAYNSSTNKVIWNIVSSAQDFWYVNYLGTKVYIGNLDCLGYNNWVRFNVRYIDNETCNYTAVRHNGETYSVEGTPRNIVSNNYTIDFIQIHCTGASQYIDDLTAIYTPDFLGGGGGGGDPTDNYIGIGGTCCGAGLSFTTGTAENIEKKFWAPMTCTIRAVDISYETGSSLDDSHTYLYINGYSQGSVDELIDNGECYVARWYTNIELTNEYPIFEFYNSDHWALCNIIMSSNDIDGDGQKGFYLHSSATQKGNGKVDSTTAWTSDYDLCMKFYITQTEPEEQKPNASWTDSLTTTGESYAGVHPLYNVKTYFNYTTVFITYGVETLSYTTTPNQLWIYDNLGNPCNQLQGFSPMTIDVYDGTVGFVPYNIGNYTIKLLRDSLVVAQTVIYIYNNPQTDYYLFSIPNPTDTIEPYTVFYKESSAKDVYLAMFKYDSDGIDYKWVNGRWVAIVSESDYNDFDTADITYSISGTGYINYNNVINENGVHYWRMFAKINQYTYEPIGPMHKHYVGAYQIGNSIKVKYTPIELGEDSEATQVFIYTHNYPGGEVAVFLNGELIQHVGENAVAQFGHKIDKPGYYTVELKVLMNGTWLTLDTCYFTATIEGIAEPGSGPFVLPQITQPLGSILGLIIVFVCLFMPNIVIMSLSRASGSTITMQIPSFIYGITGGTGIGVATLMGCFPVWLIFFIVAVGIIVVAIGYFTAHGGFTMGTGGNGMGGE